MTKYPIYREQLPSRDDPFIVCAFVTAYNSVYARMADRLARSCERFSIPYTIYSIESIHQAISKNGTDDLRFTKPNIILHTLERFKTKNVLYLDSDLVVMKYPDCIKNLCGSECDFAIYNWLNDRSNEAYVPIRMDAGNQDKEGRFYRYSKHIAYMSERELCCSGGTQFYANSSNAVALLTKWQEMIGKFHLSWDDEILNYTYNNYFSDGKVKFAPLEKSYLRLPWWPHVEPVILHPDFPVPKIKKPEPSDGAKQMFNFEHWRPRQGLIFGQDCIIDIKKHRLLRIAEKKLAGISDLNIAFFIFPYDYDLQN